MSGEPRHVVNDRERRKRRARGVGPHAHPDPALNIDALVTAGAFPSRTAMGTFLGLSGSTLVKAQRYGLTLWVADRCACALGFHPSNVWGAGWWDAVARYERRDNEAVAS